MLEKLELRNGRRRGVGKPGPTLDRMLAVADTDGDGYVSFEDFLALVVGSSIGM